MKKCKKTNTEIYTYWNAYTEVLIFKFDNMINTHVISAT